MRNPTFLIAVVSVALSIGCSGASRKADSLPGTTPFLTVEAPDGVKLEKVDLSGNGIVDIWTWYRDSSGPGNTTRRLMIRKATDINGDGRPDIVAYFDESGQMVKEEIDLDYDGRADKIRLLDKGKVIREDISTRFDGAVDMRKYFENGVLVVKQIDTRHQGRFDEFQYFVNGRLARIGWDRDGDGKPEVFDENPAVTE